MKIFKYQICKVCGKKFKKPLRESWKQFKGRKYCSYDCSNKRLQIKSNPKFCIFCKKEYKKVPYESYKQWEKRKFCSQKCQYKWRSKFRIREKSSNWKGGKIITNYGYICIFQPEHPFCDSSGYVREHRLIIEKQIGRYLHKWEISHHINKIKTDNRPENLVAFKSQKAHLHFEKGKKFKLSEIIFDGRRI